jgi:predicted DNA-binding transcriptional regulator AlpA
VLDKQFIKAQELINFLGISPATFYRGMKSNIYPFNCHFRINPRGNIYFPKTLLKELTTKALNLNGINKEGTE